MSRMKYYTFVSYDLSGVDVWAVAYSTVGYFFGQYWDQLLEIAHSVGVVIVLALIVVTYVYYLRRKNRARGKS